MPCDPYLIVYTLELLDPKCQKVLVYFWETIRQALIPRNSSLRSPFRVNQVRFVLFFLKIWFPKQPSKSHENLSNIQSLYELL